MKARMGLVNADDEPASPLDRVAAEVDRLHVRVERLRGMVAGLADTTPAEPEPEKPTRYLTLKEFIEIYPFSMTTAYRRCVDRAWPFAVKDGNKWLIDPRRAEDFFDKERRMQQRARART